jgi:hypothetical protein
MLARQIDMKNRYEKFFGATILTTEKFLDKNSTFIT